VTDRLEDGHTDVARLVLDRVDDRLDALPDDHRLDLDHGSSSPDHKKSPGGFTHRGVLACHAAVIDCVKPP
jgi:hypothetical protein